MPNINIPEIRVRSLDIPEIPKWLTDASLSLPSAPPVVLEIGLPIVDIPGCVEAHETNNPKNNQIKRCQTRSYYNWHNYDILKVLAPDFACWRL